MKVSSIIGPYVGSAHEMGHNFGFSHHDGMILVACVRNNTANCMPALPPCYKATREYELREPIPHIGLCSHHKHRSSIFKRNVIGQIVKTVKTQKSKLSESVGKEVHLTFLEEDVDFVLKKCGKHKGSKNRTTSGAPDRVRG